MSKRLILYSLLIPSTAMILAGTSFSAIANSESTKREGCEVSDVACQESVIPPLTLEAQAEETIRIPIRQIQVTGSSVFTPEQFNPIVQPYEGRDLTLEEIRQVADGITQLYLNAGYLNSRARPVSQTLEAGILEIQVTEGRLTDIEIEGNRRVKTSYIRSRIELGAGVPLNSAKLEDQLRLLRLDPLFANVEATLQPTGQVGESKLIVRVKEANPLIANVSFDNYSPPSIGGERFGVVLGTRNLTGLSDQFVGSYYPSVTGGSHVLDFSYQVPLNSMNGSLQLRAAPYWQKITQDPFDELDISANNQLYSITYRQPVIRTPRQELAFSIGFTYQDGQTFVFDQPFPFGIGPDENGVSRTSVINLGQDYLSRDTQGSWFLRSQFNIGIGLFDATTNDDPIPDGHFFSWLGQVQRVQQLGDSHLLIMGLDLQLTPDSLLPQYQFVIGGGQSVRGYRQNVRSGDNGIRFSIEDRITLVRNEAGISTIQLAPFIDIGAVWNVSDNPNKLPQQNFLVGAGLGFIWDEFLGLDGLSLRVDYGYPFIDLDDRGDNIQDDGIYFSINYRP